jgi:hypothetical protein
MNGLKVRESKIHGKGLFANKEFNEGDLIGIAHINGNPTGMIGRFHNHSDKPNAHSVSFGNKKYLAALRPLMKGEEITVDYRRQPDLEQPEQFQNGGESGDRFKKRLMKRYPGMQGVYGPEGENLNIVKDPNYDARSVGYGDIEFSFPGDPYLRYDNIIPKDDPNYIDVEEYIYSNIEPDKYNSVYNPRGANRRDVFLDMMHGMRDDPNFQPLLQNFEKAVKNTRGEDMDWQYEGEVQSGSTQSKERFDENYVDGQLRAELAPKTIGRFSKGRKDYRMERKYDSPEMKAAAKDIHNYIKGKYQDGGESKKRKKDSKGRYRSEDGNIRTPITPEMKAVMTPDEWGQYVQEVPEVYTTRTKEQQDIRNALEYQQRMADLYPGRPTQSDAIQSADWLWQLGMLGAAGGLGRSAVKAAETAGSRALPYITGALETSIPGMASVPGATVGNALAAAFAVNSGKNLLEVPTQIQKGQYADAAANVLTGALDIGTAGIVSPIYKGAKATASELGKFVGTEKGLLSNTYKLNPWAFKANPEAGYRMIGGKKGYLDAITSGEIRPTGAYDVAHFNIGQPLNPNRLSAEELIQAGSPGGYKGPYMAEMKDGTWQRMTDAFSNNPEMQEQFKLLGKDKDVWQHPLFGNIKVDDPRLKLYKEHWLHGYKEVPKELQEILPSELANVDRETLLKFLGPKITNNTGKFNLGVYEVPNHPNVLVKFEDPISVAKAQKLDVEDMSSLVEKTKELDPKRFSKVLKIVPGKGGKQALIMPKLEGVLASKLQPEVIDEIPNESIIQFYKDIKTLRDKDLNFDFMGDNFMYDPKTQQFKLFDFSPQTKNLDPNASAEDLFFQDIAFGGGNKNIYGKEKAGKNLKKALEEKLLQTYMNSYRDMDIDPEVFKLFDNKIKNILKDIDPKKFGGAAYL